MELRRTVYALLIVLAAAAAAGRILAAGRVYEPWLSRDERNPDDRRSLWPRARPAPMPTFSSNDRSRWATVRALVDEGTYAIGRRDPSAPGGVNQYGDRGIIFEDGYESVDKALHPQRQIFYSTKPPLLTTMIAGEYWLLKHDFGWTMKDNIWEVVDAVLFTFNWLPMIVYLALLARLVERYGRTDWGRLYVLAAACFGTLLTPFLITVNNHTPAAFAALFALYPALDIWNGRKGGVWQFVLAGFFAGFTACMELPAAAFAAGLFCLLWLRAPRPTLSYALPAALVPVAAFFLTNYIAVGMWEPVYSKVHTPWYEYEGSHWRVPPGTVKPGIDFANEPKSVYAFHLLLGHHGLFSLTPIFLLSVAGFIPTGRRLRASNDEDAENTAKPTGGGPWALVAPLTAFLSVIVVSFYIFKTNNYGGWSCGPRWLIWLTPLWLLTMFPVSDRLAAWRAGRVLAYVLLAFSVLSAAYPVVNPWRMPWIYNFMEAHGWIKY
jgi:hypothetical protein